MAKVDGIVLDVRDDGGGSLSTVWISLDFSSSKAYCANQISRKKKRGSDRDKKWSGMVH
jgi:C-terminal processing protease CtpA/Prc